MSNSNLKWKLSLYISIMSVPLVICVLPGLLITIWGFKISLSEYASVEWPTTTGTIISSRVVTHNSHPRDIYTPQISYEYLINGKKYSSQEFSFKDFLGKTISQDIVKQYPSGRIVTIYYNPDDPKIAVIEPGTSWFNVPFFLSGCFLILGLMWCMNELKNGRLIAISTHLRLSSIVFGILSVAILSGLEFTALSKSCSELSQSQCNLLWGIAIVSALGTILAIEIFIAGKQARGEWGIKEYEYNSGGVGDESPKRTISRAFFISNIRMILVSILAALPLIIVGGFLTVIIGVGFGLCLVGLIRGVMGWLPPIKE